MTSTGIDFGTTNCSVSAWSQGALDVLPLGRERYRRRGSSRTSIDSSRAYSPRPPRGAGASGGRRRPVASNGWRQ